VKYLKRSIMAKIDEIKEENSKTIEKIKSLKDL
jgi:hypothetical protein